MEDRSAPRPGLTLLAALVGALAISFSAIFFALSGVDPITGAVFRAVYALPVLLLIWWTTKSRDNRPRKKRLLAFAAGLMLGVDVVLWHNSIDHIGAGLATLIANSQVIFVAIGAWIIHREQPSRRLMTAVPVVLFGVALVSGLGQDNAFGDNPIFGAILALAAAMFYATFILGFRASNDVLAPPAGPLLEATFGALLTPLVIGAISSGVDMVPTWPAHGWLVALALGAQVFGWLLIGYVLPRLPAVETATIILIQPVLTMVWGAWIFGERPSVMQLMGAAIVLAGVGFVAVARGKSTTSSHPSSAVGVTEVDN